MVEIDHRDLHIPVHAFSFFSALFTILENAETIPKSSLVVEAGERQ